ncbi:MAG: hypothetical protein PHI88_03370 [Candidatus Pacebacteria bacterium]|nr:hypothetical protein [Candidatus Paceibacterota bacterium]
MAISIESISEGKKDAKQSFKMPIWGIWLLIVIITFGFLFYFLFLQKPAKEDIETYTSEGEVLTKEELDSFEDIIIIVNKTPIKDLKQVISKSIFSSPPKDKVGATGNPFVPAK